FEELEDPDERAQKQQDAYQRVSALLERLGASLLRDLPEFLSLFMGAQVVPLACEHYDGEGRLLAEELYAATPSGRALRYQPIDWATELPGGSRKCCRRRSLGIGRYRRA
ncbi:MAG: hypothetical protein ACLGIN_17055, partial [Candidatus Sericytochromatia bacterium]